MKYLDNYNRLKAFREAGKVKRCHTIPHIHEYNIANHCYNMIAMLFVLHPQPNLAMVQAIMAHDLPERWTGDIPRPAKLLYGSLDKCSKTVEKFILVRTNNLIPLEEEQQNWLAALDISELYCWAFDQIHLGNKNAAQIKSAMFDVLKSNWVPEPVREFIAWYSPDRLDDHFFEQDKHELAKN